MRVNYLNECSIIRLPKISAYDGLIKDIYNKLSNIKFSSNCIVCIDYMPLLLYSETGSPMYCMLGKNEDCNITVSFRTKQQNGFVINNMLLRYIFNYDAIQGVIAAGLVGYKELIEDIRYNLAQFSRVCEITGDKTTAKICNRIDKVVETVASNISLDSLNLLLSEIDNLNDTLSGLALFVFLSEYDAIIMKESVDIFRNEDVKTFTVCQWLDDLHAVSINTYELHILQSLAAMDDNFKDSLAQGTDVWKFFNEKQSRLNSHPSKMYDIHMIMANYELINLRRSMHRNASQDLLYSLAEFVPINLKFTNVPNPILDDRQQLYAYLTEIEQKYKLSNDLHTAIVYQYKVFGSQFMKTSFKLLEDANLTLVGVYMPCSVFDKYFTSVRLKPRDIDFLPRGGSDLQYSTYFATAIILSIYLKNSIEDNIILNEAAGSLSYSQIKKDNGGFKNVYSVNTIGSLGIDSVICGKFENSMDKRISMNSLLAYKAFLAAGKNIGSRVEKEFGTFLRDFNRLCIGGF